MAHSDADVAILTKHGTSPDKVVAEKAKSLRSNDLGDILRVAASGGKFNSQGDKDTAVAAVSGTAVQSSE